MTRHILLARLLTAAFSFEQKQRNSRVLLRTACSAGRRCRRLVHVRCLGCGWFSLVCKSDPKRACTAHSSSPEVYKALHKERRAKQNHCDKVPTIMKYLEDRVLAVSFSNAR